MLTSFFYIVSLVGIALLGLATFINRSSRMSSYFSMLSFSIAGWLGVQFLATRLSTFAFGLTIFGLIVFSFIPGFVLLFTTEFVGFSASRRLALYRLSIFGIFALLLLSILPGTIKSVEVSSGSIVLNPGPLYTIQSLIAAALITLSIGIFVAKFRKFSAQKKASSYFLISGFFIAALGSMLSGLVFADTAAAQFMAPLSLFLMTGLISYAISKHSLFDLRLVVVRSVGYILSLGTIAILTAIVLFRFSGLLVRWNVSASAQQWFYVFFTLVLATLYGPLKRLFDNITKKLFYRDAYDSQQLLDSFNQVLVSTIDLEVMSNRINEIVEQTIKPEFCAIALKETSYQDRRIISSRPLKIEEDDINYARLVTPGLDRKVFVADRSPETSRDLQRIMRKNNIGVLVRLTADAKAQGIGYILLGYKKSGNPYTPQDIQVLEIMANALVVAIQNALGFEEIQQFNVTLQEKIDSATTQLKHANQKLVALNDTKDDFISMASHQLRTPLTAVKGNISMIMDGDFGKIPNDVRDPLGQAFASSERMVGLIADLLNVSRLRTGKFAIQPVPSNLDSVVQSELRQLQESAHAHKLKLTYKGPDNFPTLMLDEIKIRQVIMNFVDNAIYYTPAGGNITVTLSHTAKAIEFTVVDDGIGVPRDLQHHLFTKFYRAGNAQKMRPDGTGIGLFMAKKVIIASGGSIIFKSVEGKGSTFGFTLAKAKAKLTQTTHGSSS